jgi:hypothetical protein
VMPAERLACGHLSNEARDCKAICTLINIARMLSRLCRTQLLVRAARASCARSGIFSELDQATAELGSTVASILHRTMYMYNPQPDRLHAKGGYLVVSMSRLWGRFTALSVKPPNT